MRQSNVLKLLVLAFGLMMVVAACGGNGDESESADEETPQDSAETEDSVAAETTEVTQVVDTPTPDDAGPPEGFLVWTHDQEPPDLHVDDPKNGLDVTTWIRAALIEGLFGIDRTTSYYPELLAGEPTLTVNDDKTVRIDYTLRPGLTWSDGTPLTSADVEYTHNIFVEGCATEADGSIINGSGDGCIYLIGNRTGYDLVTAFDVTSDTEFSITMAGFFAGWKELYIEVYAAHAFGADAAAVNRNLQDFSGLPSSGPMIVDAWERGVALDLVRNDNYHGSNSPDARNTGPASIDGVRVAFAADTDSQIDALLSGQAQIIMTKPQLDFEQLVEDENFTVATSAGTVFEHWGMNLLNVHLAKPEVREAVAYALDKGQLMEELYTPLYGPALAAEGLGNTYWLPNQAVYEDHQTKYAGNNTDAARAALETAGYALGVDDIYEHPVDGRLRLRVGTTGGDGLREQQQQVIQQQFAGAGIDLVIDNVAGGGYFSQRPFAPEAVAASISGGTEGDSTIWDIAQFGWVGGPWPGGQSGAYRGGSGNNPYGFNNPDFDVRASECDATVDETERAACYNELDTYVTTLDKGVDGLFMIPLTQKPSFFGYRSDQVASVGVAPDVRRAGPLSNVVDYEFN
ncbi:MAG: ABC transporter substrate-binding protein [Acidimicrobiales bacterium]